MEIARVFMEKKTIKILDEDNLIRNIDKLRDVLNEMCCTLDDQEINNDKLIVSQQLDKLIFDYMMLKSDNKTDKAEIIT